MGILGRLTDKDSQVSIGYKGLNNATRLVVRVLTVAMCRGIPGAGGHRGVGRGKFY